MSSVPVFVGLDYHQASIQVCVLDQDGEQLANRAVVNDARAVAQFIRRHGEAVRVAIEACCGAANLAEELRGAQQLPIDLAHPGYVARMKRSADKTDFGDAGLLADLARVNYLPKVWLAPEATRELRRLVRHRAQLVARRKDSKLRVRGLLRENRLRCEDASAWSKAWIWWVQELAPLSDNDRFIANDHLAEVAALAGRIKACEQRIKAVTADDPLMAKLMALPQVALVTAATIRAEVGRVDRFDSGKQLARFCGVTPRNASSGQRQADAGLIKAGNPELRKVLIELAHRLIFRLDNHWAELAHGMLQRGKPKNVVVAAVANRWVRWLFHELQRPAGDLSPSSTKGGPPLPPPPAPRPGRVKAEARAKAEGAHRRRRKARTPQLSAS